MLWCLRIVPVVVTTNHLVNPASLGFKAWFTLYQIASTTVAVVLPVPVWILGFGTAFLLCSRFASATSLYT